jgi:hypothetical protein
MARSAVEMIAGWPVITTAVDTHVYTSLNRILILYRLMQIVRFDIFIGGRKIPTILQHKLRRAICGME